MSSAGQLIRRFSADVAGATATEYAICLTLLVAVAVGAIALLAMSPSAVSSVSSSLSNSTGGHLGSPLPLAQTEP